MSVQLTNLVYLKYLRDMKRTTQQQRGEFFARCRLHREPATRCGMRMQGSRRKCGMLMQRQQAQKQAQSEY